MPAPHRQMNHAVEVTKDHFIYFSIIEEVVCLTIFVRIAYGQLSHPILRYYYMDTEADIPGQFLLILCTQFPQR